jgi:GGDEF domain-containing protein
VFNGQDVFQVCVPVFHDGEKHGSLSLIWSAKELESEVRRMILEGVLMFIAVIITVGIILFYAYRKNKANIKIAYYDKLTGLPNSEYFVEYMKDEIKNSDNSKKAVMLINCRNFRTLNITYGFS